MVVVAPIPNTYLMKRSLYITFEQTFRVTPLFLNSTFGTLSHQATFLAQTPQAVKKTQRKVSTIMTLFIPEMTHIVCV